MRGLDNIEVTLGRKTFIRPCEKQKHAVSSHKRNQHEILREDSERKAVVEVNLKERGQSAR